ncbi:AsmA-like C-terminal region-containing protein [Marinifilum fragile]|uniref:AsmA-like C-terminal region-containing protein n=1 Tax=Marinifilum fragile TaxID=570161 RepID=UPI002AABC410|nr:AsmA-like C-terminal region-containing protein [Marinifilum fragile]
MRILKKVGLAFLVLVVVLTIATAISLWYLFTPEKITPLVNKQAKNYLTCTTTIEKVEPTFFSTYPFFGLELTNLCLSESPKDTLFYSSKCFASVDVMSYLFDDKIILNPFLIAEGNVNVRIDAQGRMNLDVYKGSSDSEKKDSEPISLGDIDISNVKVKSFNVTFTDDLAKRKTKVQNLDASLTLKYSENKQLVDLDMKANSLLFETADSMALHMDAQGCDLKIKSNGKDKNLYHSDIKLACKEISLSMAGDELLSQMKIGTHLPFDLNISKNSCDLQKVKLTIEDEQEITCSGMVSMLKDESLEADLQYATNELDVEKVLTLVPKAYAEPLKDIKAKGLAQISGSVKGQLSDTSMPLVKAKIDYSKGEVIYTGYPTVKDLQCSLVTNVDLNGKQPSDISISNSFARIANSSVSVKGNISNILESPVYDLYTKGDFTLADLKPFIPKDQNVVLKGSLQGNAHAQFSQDDVLKEKYHRIKLSGDFKAKDFHTIYNDSINLNLDAANIKLKLPGHSRADKDLLFANIKLDARNMDVKLSPDMSAATEDLQLSVKVNNPAKGLSAPISSCTFAFASLRAKSDTLSVYASNAKGELAYVPSLKGKQEIALINSTMNSEKLAVSGKDTVLFDTKALYAKTNLKYDESQENVMLKWQPEVDIRFSDAIFNLNEKLRGQIPSISFALNQDQMKIEKASLILGDSDFSLSGELTDINKYLNEEALLKGKFNLTSKNTDVYQLMDIFNGMGSEETASNNEAVKSEDDPFMVPKGVEIRLNTNIDKTIVSDNVIENIKGGLTVKDGTLVLDQMGFTSKAANMQLTAIYRSDRKNHLFTGIDFHLLDIDIAELIDLIPTVDTMIPMLKSFKGKGEFHLAGETYLKSDYSLKNSTIRGAAAFQGEELTLMDSETFDMIASKLMFKKKTENVIDRLSVEMTLYKDEIDLYPFLIEMDNYKAVLSGRHNLDNHFNYHISVTDTPLPVRLGLNVSGTLEDLDYKLVPCKYKHLYNPEKQGKLEQQTLRLKNLISTSLKENVKAYK